MYSKENFIVIIGCFPVKGMTFIKMCCPVTPNRNVSSFPWRARFNSKVSVAYVELFTWCDVFLVCWGFCRVCRLTPDGGRQQIFAKPVHVYSCNRYNSSLLVATPSQRPSDSYPSRRQRLCEFSTKVCKYEQLISINKNIREHILMSKSIQFC